MSNVYAAYGPVPTSVGVTATPRLNGSLDRRALASRSAALGRSATLGRHNNGPMGRYPMSAMGCSYQDLRRSRDCLEIKHGPMELLEPLDTLSMGGGVLCGSLDSFPTLPTSTLERRRNGGVVTGCSVHGGGGTLSRADSRASRYDLSEERRGGCCGRSCCTLTLSLIACLLILSGVIVALYFFIKNVPYEPRPPIEEEPCEQQFCAWGGECVTDEEGVATCACPTTCPPPSSTTSPVCGTDGNTYPTICELRRHACRNQREIRIRHSGSCDDAAASSREDDTVRTRAWDRANARDRDPNATRTPDRN
ncbi:uncharacterized protein LOC121874461 [Homarus americanus]|uniref:uncharacterized protein LOC121874461 n=1 Tax=Homarus americanus TaxID=6706 RepID=UPI001C467857|nr:uncharacterized protein LOC121874461 [Homarus americanus]